MIVEVKKTFEEHSDLLSNSEKILYLLYTRDMSYKELNEFSGVPYTTIQKTVYRSDRDTGLIVDGLVEKKIISNTGVLSITVEGKNQVEESYYEINNKVKNINSNSDEEINIEEKVGLYKNYFDNFWRGDIESKIISIDIKDLMMYNPKIVEDILDNTEKEMNFIEGVVDMIRFSNDKYGLQIINLPNSQKKRVQDIRNKDIGKVFSFSGRVVSKTKVQHKANICNYECPSCGQIINVLQKGREIIQPEYCNCGRKGRFNLISKKMRDYQVIKLEQINNVDDNSQTYNINVELYDFLTDNSYQKMYNIGNNVKISAIVKEEQKLMKNGKKSNEFFTFLEAYSVESENELYDFTPTSKEIKDIEEFSKKSDCFDLITKSICPNIYGYEDVKRAIALSIVGSDLKKSKSNIHMVFVGDGSLGKTDLAESVLDLKPSSSIINGAGSSNVGISASVVSDEFSGLPTIRPGALVLANNSICIIDEFDKMKETNSLYDILEKQRVKINKNGINTELEANTTVIITANPKYGKFDETDKDIISQINMPQPLLTRFDLIFKFDDTTDNDEKISDILLEREINEDFESDNDFLDRNFLRKYLFYASNFNTRFDKKHKDYIKDIYVKLRKMKSSHIKPRHFQALIRLSMASAKINLHRHINKSDIDFAVNLFLRTWSKVVNNLDFNKTETGYYDDDRKLMKSIKKILSKKKEVSHLDLVTFLDIDDNKVTKIIKYMITKGDVYEKTPGKYKIL